MAVALMDQYLQQLNLEAVEGRAAIAQHLHAPFLATLRPRMSARAILKFHYVGPLWIQREFKYQSQRPLIDTWILGAQVGQVGHESEPIERHDGRSSRVTSLQVDPTVTSA